MIAKDAGRRGGGHSERERRCDGAEGEGRRDDKLARKHLENS
jgi:hypothetical protein